MYSGNLKPDQVLLLTATKAAVAGGSEGRRKCPKLAGKLTKFQNSLEDKEPIIIHARMACDYSYY